MPNHKPQIAEADYVEAGQHAEAEEKAFASVLVPGGVVALAVLAVTFAIYLSGAIEPYVPADRLSQYWSSPAGTYVQAVEAERGWWWATKVAYGDYLNYVGVALLLLLPALAYLRVLPKFLGEGNWLLAGVVLVELMLIALSASGWLVVGG